MFASQPKYESLSGQHPQPKSNIRTPKLFKKNSEHQHSPINKQCFQINPVFTPLIQERGNNFFQRENFCSSNQSQFIKPMLLSQEHHNQMRNKGESKSGIEKFNAFLRQCSMGNVSYHNKSNKIIPISTVLIDKDNILNQQNKSSHLSQINPHSSGCMKKMNDSMLGIPQTSKVSSISSYQPQSIKNENLFPTTSNSSQSYSYLLTKSNQCRENQFSAQITQMMNAISKKPPQVQVNLRQMSKQNFQILKLLGQGNFAKVFLAMEKNSGFLVALKEISKEEIKKSQLKDLMVNEIKFQIFLDHPNIIKQYGFFNDKENLYLIQEYISGLDLFKTLAVQKNNRFPEVVARGYIQQIIEALIYLQEKKIVHRDIKPENIILTKDNIVKLSDFGCAKLCFNQNRNTFCGTIDYLCPEIVRGQNYGHCVDSWGLGVLTYELVVGRPPFQSEDCQDVFSRIVQVNVTFPQFVSPFFKDFVIQLLHKCPQTRMSVLQAREHKWILQTPQNPLLY